MANTCEFYQGGETVLIEELSEAAGVLSLLVAWN